MMKLIIIGLIAYGVWSYYEQNIITPPVNQVSQPENKKNIVYSPTEDITPSFSCDGREHCSQMSSYEESLFFINNCPNTKMDGDHDGKPCERQFSH